VKLATSLTYQHAVPLAREAERLGYALVLVGEGYACDAPSVLGLVAGQTERIGLVSAVMQIPARPPGLTALTAASLNALSGGRFRLGLGVSNPEVSLGWYGVPFDRPLERTREYVDIVRRALLGTPTGYPGRRFWLPGAASGAPLHIRTQPPAPLLPVYLAAGGPRNLRLAGEIADGWIGVFSSPEDVTKSVTEIRLGRGERDMAGFEVLPTVPACVADDTGTAVEALREHYVQLFGIGSQERNVYCRLACSMGFEREIAVFRERLAAGDRRAAGQAIPRELIERTSLAGPVPHLAERIRAYQAAGATTLGIKVTAAAVSPSEQLRMLDAACQALEMADVGTDSDG